MGLYFKRCRSENIIGLPKQIHTQVVCPYLQKQKCNILCLKDDTLFKTGDECEALKTFMEGQGKEIGCQLCSNSSRSNIRKEMFSLCPQRGCAK